MTLVLELAPEEERELEAAARIAGQSVSDYALHLLREANLARRAEISRRLAALDEWDKAVAARPDYRAQAGLPPLGDTSRSAEPDIYGYSEHEDAQR
ncbi:MAG TPA: hypothetical protein VGB77_06500 [Abditibacteriaceae bacterium]|jgi:hypothetical protein